MIKNSSEYKICYYNIHQLENRLEKDNLATSLWSVPKSRLKKAFIDILPISPDMDYYFLKDISDEKDDKGNSIFRGLFVVASKKVLSETEMQILLTQYVIDNPDLDRSIKPSSNVKHKCDEENTLSENEPNEDLNVLAENLENDNLIFGVIDDISHLDAISQIPGVEIIENFGDFKKSYFSIPSFRQDEILAHSVTIIKQIKCKRALLDFIG